MSAAACVASTEVALCHSRDLLGDKLCVVLQLQLMTSLLTLASRLQSSPQLITHHQQLMSVSVAHYASCQRQLSSSQQVLSHAVISDVYSTVPVSSCDDATRKFYHMSNMSNLII